MKRLKNSIKYLLRIKFINIPVIFFLNLIKKAFPQGLKKQLYKIPVNKIFSVKFDGRKIKFYSNGRDTIASQVFWGGVEAYEKETVSLVNFLSKNVNSFFDIGANTGIYSLIAASSGKNISVHSFEPLKDAFEVLKKNKILNNFSNLTINEVALGSFDGKSILHVTRGNNKSIPLGASLGEVVEKKTLSEELTVQTMKLDTYIQGQTICNVDFIKIDTEGMEPKVFEGAQNVLKNSRPIIICEVLFNLIEKQLHGIFDVLSYYYYLISNRENQNYKLKKCDVIIGDLEIVSNYVLVPSERIPLVEKYLKT